MLIHLFFATGRAGGVDCVAETNGLHDKGDEVLFVRSVSEFLERRALSEDDTLAKSTSLGFLRTPPSIATLSSIMTRAVYLEIGL